MTVARDLVRNASCDLDSSLTAVMCVESGLLEAMTVRLVESLRKFGGRFRDIQVIAVKPRRGPPLVKSTLTRLDELGVRFVSRAATSKYSWYHFLNKPLTLLAAEEYVTTESIAWLDADLLFFGEPTSLGLSSQTDFSASAPDNDVMASGGPADPNDVCWRVIADILGVVLEQLPYQVTRVEKRRIRLYWQGGIFVYRRQSGFSQTYMTSCLKLLDAKVVFSNGAHWLEQMALTFATASLKLRCAELPWSHNYATASYLESQFDPLEFSTACVVHYHDSMGPHFFPRFLEYVCRYQPHAFEWLSSVGAIVSPAPESHRIIAKLLRVPRGVQRLLHRSRSRLVAAAE